MVTQIPMSKCMYRQEFMQNYVISWHPKWSKSWMKHCNYHLNPLNNMKEIQQKERETWWTQMDKIETGCIWVILGNLVCDVTIILSVKEFHSWKLKMSPKHPKIMWHSPFKSSYFHRVKSPFWSTVLLLNFHRGTSYTLVKILAGKTFLWEEIANFHALQCLIMHFSLTFKKDSFLQKNLSWYSIVFRHWIII